MQETIQIGEKTIHLIGTAHVSEESVREVQESITAIQPDTLCVELCEARLHSLQHQASWQEMNIVGVIREGKAAMLFGQLILSGYQRKIADTLGTRPGAEMSAAVALGQEIGAEIITADRDVSITLKRTWATLSFWEKAKLLFKVSAGAFASEEEKIDAQTIEEIKQSDAISQMVQELGAEFPSVKTVIIDERDAYLAHHIFYASGPKIVAVVGAGHMRGICEQLRSGAVADTARMGQFMRIPPKKKWLSFLLKWGIPLLVCGIIAYGFVAGDTQVSLEMVKRWVLINGILAALGALLAGGHLFTILAAFVASPFTSINPAVAAGWVAGLVEAWIRQPKVRDFETLARDTTSLKGFRKNKITKILLIVVCTNLGSALGSFIGIPLISSLL